MAPRRRIPRHRRRPPPAHSRPGHADAGGTLLQQANHRLSGGVAGGRRARSLCALAALAALVGSSAGGEPPVEPEVAAAPGGAEGAGAVGDEVAGTLELVRVVPQSEGYEIAPGLVIPSPERPFWIMRHEISNQQAAFGLHPFEDAPDRYKEWVLSEFVAERADTWQPGEFADMVAVYRHEHPDGPAVALDPAQIKQLAIVMSGRLGRVVRLPTLGEWLAASAHTRVRVQELPAREAIQSGLVAWRDAAVEPSEPFAGLRPVGSGAAVAGEPVNLIGNASELVVLSDREREVVEAWLRQDEREALAAVVVHPYLSFAVGGSVGNIAGGLARTAPDEVRMQVLLRNALDPNAFLPHGRTGMVLSDNMLPDWWAGARFVVEDGGQPEREEEREPSSEQGS